MTIYETEVPGVGHKFELEIDGEERLVVIIHHDGKRDVYRRPDPDADSERLFSLSDKQARQFGSILEGAHFQPVDLDEVQVPLGDSLIEWYDIADLDEGPPIVGETLAESNLREAIGVSVVAIQRGEETIANPEATETVRAGDTLVVLGTREQQHEFEELLDA
ncbi:MULTISPECIES: cation:proton antiporter regulatory subunit [Halomicrobium]|uniref:TrkA-C domain protein n=2 Tax=Halomicrobium mukohataei TaxID=57705 RepID=C7P022_HALMD|nr:MULTISPECIES: TrkA C-terminal domain-containing protein [Halomicrobium]ACV46930.1 TrkA-C domain protein [Halomicrobium mukohataei DSM 12286]QCD65426.1 potassium transporter TrkA [Halomicrobium mukohataei]QFR20232.1 potassium transporter TrkA [Halomicrobium sp. ZPS1]